MDEFQLTLFEIHKSIDAAIKSLKIKLNEVEVFIGDSSKTKQLVEDVLQPACKDVRLEEFTGIGSLRNLVSLHQEHVNAKNVPNNSSSRIQITQDSFFLPVLPANNSSSEQIKPRPPGSAGVRYPAISPRLTESPKVSICVGRGNTPLCRVRPPSSGASKTVDLQCSVLMERQKRLIDFCDHFETCNSKLQEMFTQLTQKVLVPLQTFCKPIRHHSKKQSQETQESSRVAFKEKIFPKDLNKNEFVVVETLNNCRQLLWQDHTPETLFSSEHSEREVLKSKRCDKYAIVTLHTEVLMQFSTVLNYTTLWLKREEIYIENAKSGFSRAHRRFMKTQRMWQEARQKQRSLSEEWKNKIREIQSHETRLETLENNTATLKEALERLQDERQTVEIQLLNATEGIDRLRSQHRNLRKHINLSNKKLEAKERSSVLLQSRLRSFKADRDAAREKLQINHEFVQSLQEKMIKIFNDREAWKKRYEEKIDPAALKKKLESVELRVPSMMLREKTFVLKSRSENLRDAVAIITSRLDATQTPWPLLCHYLTWPRPFLLTLRSSNARARRRAFSDRDSSSASSSASSQNSVTPPNVLLKDPNFIPSVSTQRIVNYVKSNCPGTENEKCAYMLKLWLDKNGQQATLEQLVKALKEVRQAENASTDSQ